jgi:nicotinamide-nucleotide amidase
VRCEVVAIGTELLLGQIIDSNSAWIGEQLALAGIDCHFQVKVGDNFKRIEACIRQGLERADAVICCGGLGPTQDDITRDVIAHVMGVEMRRDDAIAEKIRLLFESRGRVMTANNLRQADVPEGATPIPQMPGTAPGLVCPVGAKVVYAVPGVPSEMREMMLGTILPDLQRRSGQPAVIRSRVLRTWGQSESGLAEMLADRVTALDAAGNPTIAFQASGIEGLKVRITAKAADEAAAASLIADEEALVRGILGDLIFGVDTQTLESVVLDMLRERGMTLAVAESLTGGIMAARLSEIDPAMQVFRGARIANGVDGAGNPRPAPEDRATGAAQRARGDFATDVGIAAIAPDADEGHPPGAVFLGLAIGNQVHADRVALPGDRPRLRNYSVISLLNYLRKTLAST